MNSRSLLLIALVLTGCIFAGNSTMPTKNISTVFDMIKCRTDSAIGLLNNQSSQNASLAQYASTLQQDETTLQGYVVSGDASSFWSFFKGQYVPDVKAAFRQLRQAFAGSPGSFRQVMKGGVACAPSGHVMGGLAHFRKMHPRKGPMFHRFQK